VRVLDLFVVLEDGFDFLDDLVEGPFGEFRCDFGVLEFVCSFHGVGLVDVVFHVHEGAAFAGHFLHDEFCEVTVLFVVEEEANLTEVRPIEASHHSVNEWFDLFLLHIAFNDLNLWSSVACWHTHRLQYLRYRENRVSEVDNIWRKIKPQFLLN